MNIARISQNLVKILSDKATYKYLIPGAVVTLIYGSFVCSLPDTTESAEDLSWFEKIVNWFISSLSLFANMVFEFVVITLFSPLMAMLSEYVETRLTGKIFEFSMSRFVTEILRTIGILITGFIFSFLAITVWQLVAWIGELNTITPYILLVLTAFFIGVNFMDYSLERHLVTVGQSWSYALRRPVRMLLVGAVFSALFAIPILGVMLAPFVATILATLIWLDEKGSEKQQPDVN